MLVEEEQVESPPHLTAEEAEAEFPGSSEFVHLHNHTLFSLLDGVAKPEEYFEGAAQRKWPAVAITEHGTLNSIPDNYFASKEFGVKYLVGCEFYYADYDRIRQEMMGAKIRMSDVRKDDPDLAGRILRHRHLTIIAKDEVGYRNLLAMNLDASLNNFYYKPRASMELLGKYHEGLIILSGCLNGPVSHELRAGNFNGNDRFKGAIQYMKEFKGIFGDDFYVELQMPGVEGEKEVFQQLLVLADHLKVKPVITNDTHYMQREDFLIQKVMMAVDQNLPIDSPDLFHVNSDEQYLKTRHELRATFHQKGFVELAPVSVFETACDNTLEIAEKCKPFAPDLGPKLPSLENDIEELCRLALKGLRDKGLDKDKRKYLIDNQEVTYAEQMQLELARFVEKGFASYFLITRDLVMESKRRGWDLGPARGSAGGSLVCYLLDIHELDPFKWGLSFNRFLSPARGGWMLKISMDD